MKFSTLIFCTWTLLLCTFMVYANEQWYQVSCESLPNKCVERNELDYTLLLSDQCDWELEMCDINDKYSGVWKTINYYIGLKTLYPGDTWNYPSWTEQCKYGTQECREGIWQSVGHNGKCAESRDCPSHQYCKGNTGTGYDGTCTAFKEVGEECEHVFECGRIATCWFNNPNSVRGIWKDYFQINNNDTSNPVFFTYGNDTQFEDDSSLLCSSKYYHPTTGVWMEPPISVNKGEQCVSDTDCPSNIAGIYANCTWGWNNNGYKYCDILPGDDEWQLAFTRFKDYFDATKDDCNVAARWEECGQKTLYNDWMCKKLSAENYVFLRYNKNELPCLEDLKKSLFRELYEIWGAMDIWNSIYVSSVVLISVIYFMG